VYYETVFIVNPDVSQENTQILTDSLVKRVEKASGRIVKREYWGSRPLAYQIAKRKRGHYVLLVTDGEPAAVAALEQALRLEEHILRFLTARLTELSETPSPLMRRRIEPTKAEAAEAPAETSAAREDEAIKAPEEAKAAKKVDAESEKKTERKAEEATADEEPAGAESGETPARKAVTKKAEAAPAAKKKTTKSKKTDGDADG